MSVTISTPTHYTVWVVMHERDVYGVYGSEKSAKAVAWDLVDGKTWQVQSVTVTEMELQS